MSKERLETTAVQSSVWKPVRSSLPLGFEIRRAIMISMVSTGAWKTLSGEDFFSHDDYDAAHAELGRLLAIVTAARSVHAGLTCAVDPMDVDDRIAALGAALTALTTTTAPQSPPPVVATPDDAAGGV